MRQCIVQAVVAASLLLASFSAATADDAAAALSIPFTLTKPDGAGPFPAVVLLHDCSGLGPKSSYAPMRWTRELVAHGYVTIAADSFGSRGFPDGVCTRDDAQAVSPDRRVADAYAALRYLRQLSFVDPARIAVMGGSHGGATTLATDVDTPDNRAAAPPGFAAAIALYPGCGAHYGGWSVERDRKKPGLPIVGYSGAYKPLAPLLILVGSRDDWTPAEPCRQLADAADAAGYPVTVKIYPGAYHSFDSNAPIRYRADRHNVNAPDGHGATTGGDPEAWADAIVQVETFLANHLAAAPK